jgi:hypothetical protein
MHGAQQGEAAAAERDSLRQILPVVAAAFHAAWLGKIRSILEDMN